MISEVYLIGMKKRALILGFLIAQLPVWAALNPVVDSIPMRDGKKLAADVYIPIGCTSCPTILIQTPYNRLLYRFGLTDFCIVLDCLWVLVSKSIILLMCM